VKELKGATQRMGRLGLAEQFQCSGCSQRRRKLMGKRGGSETGHSIRGAWSRQCQPGQSM
jgi:hypothetical protein